MPKKLDLKGGKFGLLFVLKECESKTKHNQTEWLCLCDCGKTTKVNVAHLNSGHTKSCGCLSRKLSAKRLYRHGGTGTPEHVSWLGMRDRCTRENCVNYKDYGGRGISVCERWYNSFELFLEDMGPKPSKEHSLDRIENNGNYELGNCRWATPVEQANNTSQNKFVSCRGETKTLAQWCREVGLEYSKVFRRLKRGWPTEIALGFEKNA